MAGGWLRRLLSAADAPAGRGKTASNSSNIVSASSNRGSGVPEHCHSAQSPRSMADDWLAYRRDSSALVQQANQFAVAAWVGGNLPFTRPGCVADGEPAGLDNAIAERTLCNLLRGDCGIHAGVRD